MRRAAKTCGLSPAKTSGVMLRATGFMPSSIPKEGTRSARSIPIFGPGRVQRLCGIGGDPQHRAVVIGELAWIVHRMLFHELDHLQGAALAGDVRHRDIGFKRLV